jgi:hypothetical protein
MKAQLHTTYLVSLLEAGCLHAAVGVRLNAEAAAGHWAEHIVYFADQLLVLSVDETRKQWNLVRGEHGDQITLALV